jgi:hypothetical protein
MFILERVKLNVYELSVYIGISDSIFHIQNHLMDFDNVSH